MGPGHAAFSPKCTNVSIVIYITAGNRVSRANLAVYKHIYVRCPALKTHLAGQIDYGALRGTPTISTLRR